MKNFYKMKNKKGLLREYVVRIILVAVLCMVLLAALLFAVFNMFSGNKEKEQAKASLNFIVKMMNNAETNKISYGYIFNPKNWYIVSFSENSKDKPEKCGKCICVCSKISKCKEEKICMEVPNNRHVLGIDKGEINKKIDKLFLVTIEAKEEGTSKYYSFVFDENTNRNRVLEGREIIEAKYLLDKIMKVLKSINSPLSFATIKDSGSSSYIGENAQSIDYGAGNYGINRGIVLAIIEARYNLFRDVIGNIGDSDYADKVRVEVAKASEKEKERAIILGVVCDKVDKDYLQELSSCIAKQLKEGYDGKAEIFFNGKISNINKGEENNNPEKEIDGMKIKPENKDTAVLWFYSQNTEEVIKIQRNYEAYIVKEQNN